MPAPTLPLQSNPRTRRSNRQRRGVLSKGNNSSAPTLPLRSLPQTRRQEQKPPRLYNFSQTKITQQRRSPSLTDELKVNVLSYVPAQEIVSNCRATCQELCGFIDGHENRIADAIAKRERRRLQAHSDKLKSFGPPASVKAFLEGLRVFTEQRGFVTMKSMNPESRPNGSATCSETCSLTCRIRLAVTTNGQSWRATSFSFKDRSLMTSIEVCRSETVARSSD